MLFYNAIIIYLFFIFKITNALFRHHYAVGVTGKLLCYGKSDNNAQIQLYNKYWKKFTLIETRSSDTYGHFEVTGTKLLFTRMHPILKITHHCRESNLRCHYEGFIPITRKAIYRGRQVKGLLNLGVIEILTIQNQRRVCLRRRSILRKGRQGKAE